MSEPLRLLAGFALTASAAVAVALVISRLLRQRASARSAYIAWIVVLVAVLAPVRLFGSPVVLTVSAPQAEEAPAPTALPARTASPQTTALPVARATARPLPTDTVEAAPIARSTAAPVSAPAPTPSHVWTAEEIVLAAYLAGVVLALGIQIARHARFSRLVRRWRSRPAEHTRLLFEEVCREMGVARAPRLWICGAADSPMLMGLLRPCVLLPDESLGDEALRLVFRHELTHCRRGDLWVKLLTLLAVSLHWYNPLIYVMRRELAFACEASCDERVLRGQDLDARARYSETIVAVIRRQSRSRTALTTAFYGGKKGMKNRILSIMNTRSRRLGIFILLPVLAFALLFSIALATEKPVEPIVWRAAGSPAFLFEAEKGEPLLTREEIEQRVAELFRLYDSAAVTNVETRPVTYGKDTFDTAVVDVSVRGHAEDEAETIRLYLTPRRGEVAAQTLVHASGFETGIRWAPFPLLEDVEALEATLPREAVVASPVADAGELCVGTDNAPMGVCFNGATVTVDALTDEYVPLAKGYWAHVNVAGGAEGWMPVSVLTFADEMTGEAPTLPQAEVKAQSGIAFVYEGCNFDTVLAEVRLGETVTLLGRFAEYWLVQLANGTCGFLPLENVSLDKATQALADGVLPDAFDKEQPERSPVRSLASLFKETGEYLTAERYQEILNQSAEDGAETVLERFEIRPVTFGLDTYDCAVADVSVTYVQYIGEEKIRINVGSYSRDYLTPVNGTFVASTWLDETEDGVVEQGLIGWDPLVMENAELRELESLLPHEAVVTNPVSGATSLRRWDLFYDFYDYSPVGAYLNGVTVTVDGLMLMENNVPELTDALTVYWAHVTVAGGEAAGGAEGWLPLDALTFRHSMTAEPAALPQAEVTADTSLYAGCDAESEALAAVPAGESVTLLGRFAAYWNVQLTDGTCGFLPLDCLAPDAETRALEAEVLPERFFVLQPGWQAKYEEYRAHISALDAEWGDPFGWTLEQRAELSDYMAQFPFEPDAPRCVLPGEGDLPRAEAEAVAWDYARRQLLMPAEQVDATSAILYMDTDGSRVWEIAYRLADGKTYYSVTLDQKGKVWMGGRYTLDDEEYDLTLGSGSLRIGGSSGDSGVIGIDISGLLSSSEPQQEDTGDFAYILLEDGTACIAAYHGEAKDVTIPAELGGRAVTAIGEYAFCWKGLTSVTLPEGLETIGTAAFLGCDLEEVTVPASVRAVGNSAFANCIFLNRATFLNPDTEIGEDAFLNCPSSLVITPAPEATPRPGMDALLKFEGGTDAETFACGDYVYSLLADGTAQIEYYTGEGGEVAVPSELDGHAVTSIGHMAFYGRIKVNSVSLPEGVKTIGEYAFCQCENLAKITLPAGLGTIAYRAFERCLSLTEIALPAGLESIAYEAFADCDSLTEIVLPEGLTELGEGAFEGCNALARVTLPESLETIGELAFARCRSLAEIRFSEGLKTIGPAAFMYCVSLAEIALPGSLEVIGEDAFSLCGLTDVKLPDGLKSLGGFAFSYCHDLTRVSLPDSLAQIGPNPFAFCPALEEIVLSPDHPLLEIVDGALMDKRGKRLIYYPIAKTETAYAVPEGTRSIGDSAFNRCAALTEITLPDSLTEIGVAAFMGCGRLKTMALPEGVTVLAESTFYGCESLERVTLPAGVTEIGEDAFAKCPETLVITVTAGSYAEQYCIENGLRYEALADTAGAEVGARFTCGDYVYSLLADGTAQIEYYAGAGGEVAVPAVLDGRAVTSIGSKAFYGRIKVNSVSLPEGVKAIGEYAFYQCENLAGITLPAGLETIGHRAFEGCLSLTEIALPAGLETIGHRAFEGCISLTEIALPEGLKTIGDSAFNGCESLKAITLPGTLETIGRQAFYWCRSLEEIALPEGVTEIGDNAFMFCQSLAGVDLPGSLETIGAYAFVGCDSLTEITLPEGMVSLGAEAFYSCDGLTRVTLPNSLLQITGNPFAGCKNLKTIRVSADHPALEVKNGALLSKTDHRLICYPQGRAENEYAVPKGTLIIGEDAFRDCDSLTRVTLPEGLTAIEARAFYLCDSLSEVVLPQSLTAIGDEAFYMCFSLSKITLPDGLTVLGKWALGACDSLERIALPASITEMDENPFFLCPETLVIEVEAGSYAEQYCIENGLQYETPAAAQTDASSGDSWGGSATARATFTSGDFEYSLLDDGTAEIVAYKGSATDVTVPAQIDGVPVTKIGESAFSQCWDVETVALPGSLTEIGAWAFTYCGGLQRIEVPQSVKTLGEGAFYYCDRLQEATLPDGLTEIPDSLFGKCFALEEVRLPDTVQRIGSDAFFGCIKLERLAIPAGVTVIGDEAFYGCSDITFTVTAGSYAEQYCIENGLQYEALAEAESDFEYVLLADGTAEITKYAGSAEDVTVPAQIDGHAVTSIGESAFAGCYSLRRVVLPEGLKRIGALAFNSCWRLADAALPEGLEALGRGAFMDCALTSVALPASLSEIGANPFVNCNKLRAIRVSPDHPTLEVVDGVLFRKQEKELVCYPTAKTLMYYYVPEGTRRIGEDAFSNADMLLGITLPQSVTAIGPYAFFDCDALTQIVLPEGVTVLEEGAFDLCWALKSITLPESLTEIGPLAFRGCYALTDITLPSHLEKLGGGAFYNCRGLTEITLPNSLTEIDANPFPYCVNLRTIAVSPDHPVLEVIDGALFNKQEKKLIAYIAGEGESAYSVPEGTQAIGRFAFCECAGLTEITLPDSVKTVETGAFFGCGDLTGITLPEGLEVLGERAFHLCASLTAITLPASLAEIGENVFLDCSDSLVVTVTAGSLAEQYCIDNGLAYMQSWWWDRSGRDPQISFDLRALYIGDMPTIVSGNYEYVLLDDGTAEIVWYSVAASELTIPSSLDGHPVTAIGDHAFFGLWSLRSATVPEGVTTIGEDAFSDCPNLTRVALPGSLLELRGNPFQGRNQLCELVFSPDHPYLELAGGVLFTRPDRRLVSYPCDLEADFYAVPEGTRAIAEFAFCRAPLTALTLPESLETIGSGAFCDTAIREVTIPAGVTVLSSSVFSYCEALERVTLPDGVRSIGAGAFRACEKLEEIALPEGVTEIGNQAFSGCESLARADLPRSLKTIGKNAFSACRSLTAITLPEGLTALGNDAFYNCRSLASVTLPDSLLQMPENPFVGCICLEEIRVSDDHPTLEVRDGALFIKAENKLICYPLGRTDSEYAVPNGTRIIGEDAFRGCNNLARVTLPEGLTSIGKYAFCSCESLKEIHLPEGLTVLGEYAFWGCKSLESVTLPESLTAIDKRTFCSCESLTEITLPEGLTAIGDDAFFDCYSLASVHLPQSLETIGAWAFTGCPLEEVTVPSGVSAVGEEAFSFCERLARVTFLGADTQIGKDAFYRCPEELVIAVIQGSLAEQYCAENGLNFTVID